MTVVYYLIDAMTLISQILMIKALAEVKEKTARPVLKLLANMPVF
jgi:hypothetical protein